MRDRVTLLICLAAILARHASAVAGPNTAETPVHPQSSRPTQEVGFSLLQPEVTGVTFTNSLSPELASKNQILLNGSGVAAGDMNSDGLCDLFFCSLAGLNRLYRNL